MDMHDHRSRYTVVQQLTIPNRGGLPVRPFNTLSFAMLHFVQKPFCILELPIMMANPIVASRKQILAVLMSTLATSMM